MIDRSGILPKSPLVFTLASVRFASWPLIAKKIDEIHDELRDELPLIQQIQMQAIGINGQPIAQTDSTLPSAWMLLSGDRTRGIQLSADQVVVFSKRYTRYAEFATVLEKALGVLLKPMRFLDVTNIGVRYVDHIKVRQDETLEQYIESPLLPANFDGLKRIGGIFVGNYKVGESELRVRCVSQPDTLSIPEDLLPLHVMSQPPGKAFEIQGLKEGEILLDIDSLEAYPLPNRMDNSSALLAKLRYLHEIANAFFRREGVCTEHAFNVWKGVAK